MYLFFVLQTGKVQILFKRIGGTSTMFFLHFFKSQANWLHIKTSIIILTLTDSLTYKGHSNFLLRNCAFLAPYLYEMLFNDLEYNDLKIRRQLKKNIHRSLMQNFLLYFFIINFCQQEKREYHQLYHNHKMAVIFLFCFLLKLMRVEQSKGKSFLDF